MGGLVTLGFELLTDVLFDDFEAWQTVLLVAGAALLAPALLLPAAMAQALVLKWCVIGAFRESDVPLYSLGYFRWWCAQTLLANPLFLPGSWLAVVSSRMLGATVGRGAYLKKALPKEYDLVTIGEGLC